MGLTARTARLQLRIQMQSTRSSLNLELIQAPATNGQPETQIKSWS